jgi:gluconolactonase
MVLDAQGNIYLTAGEGPTAGIHIISPGGEFFGIIHTPEIAGNCTFGGPDLRTLYIAASTSLYRIRTNLPGHLAYPRLPAG